VEDTDVTELLRQWSSGEPEQRRRAYDDLFARVYAELKRHAKHQLRGERAAELHATTLVHQAYERLLAYRMRFEDRRHFYSVAATAMRRILVEKARRRRAQRRGGGQEAETLLDGAAASPDANPDLVLDIDRAMAALTPAQAALVELRFFAGLTQDEAAGVLGIQTETLKKRWRVVKTLLLVELDRWRAR
jgi:RNA polymerase sigma factor (TIGR02999 family)